MGPILLPRFTNHPRTKWSAQKSRFNSVLLRQVSRVHIQHCSVSELLSHHAVALFLLSELAVTAGSVRGAFSTAYRLSEPVSPSTQFGTRCCLRLRLSHGVALDEESILDFAEVYAEVAQKWVTNPLGLLRMRKGLAELKASKMYQFKFEYLGLFDHEKHRMTLACPLLYPPLSFSSE